MQNTMVGEGGGGRMVAGKKIKNEGLWGFWPKTGSGSLYLKLREILNSLLNEYVR